MCWTVHLETSSTDMVSHSYWSQNAYGGSGGAQSGWQQPIDYYCADNSIDAFPVAFVNVFFGPGGLPELNLANVRFVLFVVKAKRVNLLCLPSLAVAPRSLVALFSTVSR